MNLPNFAIFYGWFPRMTRPWMPSIVLQQYEKKVVGVTAYWLFARFHVEWFNYG